MKNDLLEREVSYEYQINNKSIKIIKDNNIKEILKGDSFNLKDGNFTIKDILYNKMILTKNDNTDYIIGLNNFISQML
tara:strand:+ start:5605 stop:5838 length:234 start_codon:yes stop_codon:yes gene_type:complete